MLSTAVLYGHSYGLTGCRGDIIATLTSGQSGSGGLAVIGFFVISGYLITGSWFRCATATEYFKRRATRIVPGFVVAVLITFFVFGPFAGKGLIGFLGDLRSYRFLGVLAFLSPPGVPTAFVNNPVPGNINGSLWTIRIEATCYALVALVGTLNIFRNRVVFATLVCCAIACGFVADAPFVQRRLHLFGASILSLIGPFAVGSAMFVFGKRVPHSWKIFCIVGIFIVAAAAIGKLRFVLGPCVAYLMLFVGLLPAPQWANFEKHGDLSYGVYLYAFPVQQLIVYWSNSKVSPLVLVSLAIPISLILAILSWKYVERPYLGYKRKFDKGCNPLTVDPRLAESREQAACGLNLDDKTPV